MEDQKKLDTRDEMAAKLGSTWWRVGIAWMWVHGFPTQAAATEYMEHVKRTENRGRVYVQRDVQEVGPDVFSVHIHF